MILYKEATAGLLLQMLNNWFYLVRGNWTDQCTRLSAMKIITSILTNWTRGGGIWYEINKQSKLYSPPKLYNKIVTWLVKTCRKSKRTFKSITATNPELRPTNSLPNAAWRHITRPRKLNLCVHAPDWNEEDQRFAVGLEKKAIKHWWLWWQIVQS
jgi:hypothetical protein